MSFGKNFMAALSAAQSMSDFFAFGPIDHLFMGNEVDLWAFVSAFVKKYGALPKFETIAAHTGETLAKPDEAAAYYLDLMRVRHQEIAIKGSMKKAQQQLQPGGEGSKAALDQIAQMVVKLMTQEQANEVADLRHAYKALIDFYAAQNTGSLGGLKLGWPYLDGMTGGIRTGDLVSVVGRPGIGKTWGMLYAAHYGWAAAELDPHSPGEPRMFVSMEMDLMAIRQRLAALNTKVKMSAVKHSAMTTLELKTYKKGLKLMEGFKAPFWVVDGNLTATVDDVVMLANQLKPSAIFIDGAYLLAHPTERDRHKRVAENSNTLKKTVAKIAPVVASWQFNRQADKKKKGEEVSLADIAHADAVGMDSSIVLGLFEEETADSVKQRRVKVLKGRSGETGEFMTHWDFDKMDFSEVQPVETENLQFV